MEPVLECKFDYKGYPCVVLFMPLGYRCGYDPSFPVDLTVFVLITAGISRAGI